MLCDMFVLLVLADLYFVKNACACISTLYRQTDTSKLLLICVFVLSFLHHFFESADTKLRFSYVIYYFLFPSTVPAAGMTRLSRSRSSSSSFTSTDGSRNRNLNSPLDGPNSGVLDNQARPQTMEVSC